MHRGSTFICGAALIAAQSCFALTVEELKLGLEEAFTNSKSATALAIYVTGYVHGGAEYDVRWDWSATKPGFVQPRTSCEQFACTSTIVRKSHRLAHSY